jgi:hypothetical protein
MVDIIHVGLREEKYGIDIRGRYTLIQKSYDLKHSIYICLFKYEPAAIETDFPVRCQSPLSPWAAFPEPPFFCPDFLRTKITTCFRRESA